MNIEKVNDSEVIDSNVKENEIESDRIKETNKEVQEPLDPTRYGDWEKNGRCIDF